jgi:hypothetical protein
MCCAVKVIKHFLSNKTIATKPPIDMLLFVTYYVLENLVRKGTPGVGK